MTNPATDKTLSQLTVEVKASFAKYNAQGTRPWTWETAARDLPYQVGSFTKVMLQLSGDRWTDGKSPDELQWQLRNELADVLAEVLFIADGLGIDMNQALEEMYQDDTDKVARRT